MRLETMTVVEARRRPRWFARLFLLAVGFLGSFPASSSAFILKVRRNVRPSFASSSSTSDDATSVDAPLWGGDFVGLSATFDVKNGNLIPIPDYFVPESLSEWGQEPSALEVIVSEDDCDNDDDEAGQSRQTVTILPATGCAVDNLETLNAVEELSNNASCVVVCQTDTFRALAHRLDDNRVHYETTFACFPEVQNHRIRMNVDLVRIVDDDNSHYELVSPVRIILERQTSRVSTKGTIADGGGLDGQRVSRMMGETLRKQEFFAEKPIQWSWTTTPSSNSASNNENNNNQERSKTILPIHHYFPGNLTLVSAQLSEGLFVVEMGHVLPDKGLRQVVTMTVSSSPMKLLPFDTRIEEGICKPSPS